MERTIKQSAERRITNNTPSERKQSYSERSFRSSAQADEQSRQQQRTNADRGSSSSTERKTTNTVGKDRLYSSLQDKRSSRGPSSSRPRSFSPGQPSWRLAKKETSVTPALDKRLSRLNINNNRRLLRGGKEETYKISGVITIEREESEPQKDSGETAAAEAPAAETPAES